MGTLLSLFDHSGNWSQPYADAGHTVIRVDLKEGFDVMNIDEDWLDDLPRDGGTGLLAAPPCTDFAVSGAWTWKAKDADGRTAASKELVIKAGWIVGLWKPDFWAFENPVGRLNTLFPELRVHGPWYWQPWWYGDGYTKKTGLWGYFNKKLPENRVTPVKVCDQGSWVQKLGGKSERTKELRSATPKGFAKAFYEANHWAEGEAALRSYGGLNGWARSKKNKQN